jgi:glycosyltransferase involved in cell wall biosynthesis
MNSAPPKILMFGWEFPPFNSGGLGVACEGLVAGLASLGAQIIFVLPKKMSCQCANCQFVFGGEGGKNATETIAVNSPLSPYVTSQSYDKEYQKFSGKNIYHSVWRKDLVGEVMRYARQAETIARAHDFDVIHCHDWLSLPAGLAAKRTTGKPLVFHIHATEYDRVNDNYINHEICAIEKEGFDTADAVVAVSDYTKRRIVENYCADPAKITVVPNAVDRHKFPPRPADSVFNIKKNGKKLVLFVGRLTFQKGPDYFLRAARKAADIDNDIIFVFSGAGDMEHWLISETARLGLADRVIFAGFLRGDELYRLYQMADLYVMPSVSEPFGLTSLEALANGAPILVSRQSGIAQMVSHCLKVDFWDVDQMAAKIVAAARYPELHQTLQGNGFAEAQKFSWVESAKKCLAVYQRILTT